ncbi:trigger factor [Alkalinema sp. FACHB-956]|uniref:trigger factor n=1 Tax=Alkalinema sp. FACHB-956 TaxID=2692768 RepID=UPI001689D5B2|nr:trigger factor [Alkalinema sp. FACHB-956]MBD2326985.1 trigger factor [Alkalinema sp. FACHB-956]
MKVTQEKLPASQIGLEIEIPAEMTKKAYEATIQKFMRQANIPGFRKGKVPRQVVLQRFGAMGIKATALEDLIDTALKDALKQEKIDSLGNFQLKSDFTGLVESYEPGTPLTFKASVDVQPEVTLKQYTGLTVQAEEIKADPDRVATTLEGYQKQLATLVPVEDRGAQLGDVAVVDYHGRYTPDAEGAEEVDVPGGKADNFQLDMEEDRFVPGFVAGLIGMKVGETKEVEVQFPEDYFSEELQGRPAKFSMTLKELKGRELPELDDDFAKELSEDEFETIAALRENLETRYQEEADAKTKQNKETALINALLTQVEVDLPETLVERELNYMITQTAMQLQQQGMDVRKLFNEDTIAMLKERSREEAIDRLKRTLALGEVAKQQELKVDEAELNSKFKETMEALQGQDIDPDRLRSVLSEDLLKEQIIAWLEANNTVELVPEGTLESQDDETAEDDSEAIEVATEVVE